MGWRSSFALVVSSALLAVQSCGSNPGNGSQELPIAPPTEFQPVIASTDYVRSFAEQIRAFVPRRYVVLGTDGYGRSDTREKLRRFFEVDRHYITVAALKALADEGDVPAAKAAEAFKKEKSAAFVSWARRPEPRATAKADPKAKPPEEF